MIARHVLTGPRLSAIGSHHGSGHLAVATAVRTATWECRCASDVVCWMSERTGWVGEGANVKAKREGVSVKQGGLGSDKTPPLANQPDGLTRRQQRTLGKAECERSGRSCGDVGRQIPAIRPLHTRVDGGKGCTPAHPRALPVVKTCHPSRYGYSLRTPPPTLHRPSWDTRDAGAGLCSSVHCPIRRAFAYQQSKGQISRTSQPVDHSLTHGLNYITSHWASRRYFAHARPDDDKSPCDSRLLCALRAILDFRGMWRATSTVQH